jgi:Zn-dependent alcohol dehydrogenase
VIHLLDQGLTKADLIVGLTTNLAGWHEAFDAMHSGKVIKSVLVP